jgi:hypothetical protein
LQPRACNSISITWNPKQRDSLGRRGLPQRGRRAEGEGTRANIPTARITTPITSPITPITVAKGPNDSDCTVSSAQQTVSAAGFNSCCSLPGLPRPGAAPGPAGLHWPGTGLGAQAQASPAAASPRPPSHKHRRTPLRPRGAAVPAKRGPARAIGPATRMRAARAHRRARGRPARPPHLCPRRQASSALPPRRHAGWPQGGTLCASVAMPGNGAGLCCCWGGVTARAPPPVCHRPGVSARRSAIPEREQAREEERDRERGGGRERSTRPARPRRRARPALHSRHSRAFHKPGRRPAAAYCTLLHPPRPGRCACAASFRRRRRFPAAASLPPRAITSQPAS